MYRCTDVPSQFLVGDLTPESQYSKVGLHLSADAQTSRNAPKGNRTISTAMLRLVAWGVTAGAWGWRTVAYAVPWAMSATRAFKLRYWFGKDSRLK